MANTEHVEIVLKGKDAVRDWRSKGDSVYLDLSGASLSGANLGDAKLFGSNLSGSNLSNAKLYGADLSNAQLYRAQLCDANLGDANLSGAKLSRADLSGANLSGAKLYGAHLSGANLSNANLSNARLYRADLSGANLNGANLTKAICGGTHFASIDLSNVTGVDFAMHKGPSHVCTDSLVRSNGAIPEGFLKGCGLQDWEILQSKMYNLTLTPSEIAELQIKIFEKRTRGPLYIGGVFISYSRTNDDFADIIYDRLKKEGVPVWLDRHDVIAGDLQKQISKAIRLNDVVLLLLSEAAVQSDWVESELDMARKREKAENRDLLCPISIDDAWRSKLSDDASDRALWRTLTKKAIIDFSPAADFETSFGKLMRGLKVNYPKPNE